MGRRTGSDLKGGGMLARNYTTTPAAVQNRRCLEGLRTNYPYGIGLLEESAEELHAKTEEERMEPGGNVIVITADQMGYLEIEKLSREKPNEFLLVEKALDVRIGVNGKVTIATCCEVSGCQLTHCPNRRTR